MNEQKNQTYLGWVFDIEKNIENGQRLGQSVMNASPVEWREFLPDVWEVNYRTDDLVKWYDHAVQEFPLK